MTISLTKDETTMVMAIYIVVVYVDGLLGGHVVYTLLDERYQDMLVSGLCPYL